jgi:hypothetical protein
LADRTTALVVVDMLNPYDHEDAEELAENVAGIVEPMKTLIVRAQEASAEIMWALSLLMAARGPRPYGLEGRSVSPLGRYATQRGQPCARR